MHPLSRVALTAVIMVMLSMSVQAASISEKTARKTIKQFILSNAAFASERQSTGISFSLRSLTAYDFDDEAVISYIAELSPYGYIVLSSDDEMPPVLFFSAKSNLDLSDNKNNAFRALLKSAMKAGKQFLDDETSIKNKDLKRKNSKKWQKFKDLSETDISASVADIATISAASDSEIIVPALLQTTWDQNVHYNRYTPESNDGYAGTDYYGGHVPTGCVATAYSQILNYYHWPWFGNGSFTYEDANGDVQGTHTVDFSNAYDWDNMQNSYDPWSSEPIEAVNAVSELMYEVGVAQRMNYEPSYASASLSPYRELTDSFYYSSPISVTDEEEITTVLIAQMNQGKPCLASIPGHAIVVDGYNVEDDSDFFHINYGWGGTNDGWYLLGGIPGGVTTVYQEFVPQFLPLVKHVGSAMNSISLQWKFPDFYSSQQSVRLFEMAWQNYADVLDTADSSLQWDYSDGQWTPSDGQFFWQTGILTSADYLVFPSLFVPTQDSELRFDMKAILGDETLDLEVSTDEGISWTTLDSWTQTGWDEVVYPYSADLSAYAGVQVLMRFKAAFTGGGYYPTGGVWLDNLQLTDVSVGTMIERSDDVAFDMDAGQVEIFNQPQKENIFQLQVLSSNGWSELSPLIRIELGDEFIDTDMDGIADISDNCSSASNSDQLDANLDGIGDACDTWSDSDNDGLSDAEEYFSGTDASSSDSDGDGLTDGEEYLAGTDATNSDSDGDGMSDGREQLCNSDPLDSNSLCRQFMPWLSILLDGD